MKKYNLIPDINLTEPRYEEHECDYCANTVCYNQNICDECREEFAINFLKRKYYIIKKANKESIKKNMVSLAGDFMLGLLAWATAVTISILIWTIAV